MILLTLDPSSTAIGYCISTGHGRHIEFGKITGHAKYDAIARLERDMLPDLAKIVEQHKPDAVLVETPSPQQGQRKATRGQATYGMAVGMVLRDLRHMGIDPQTTRADEWTNGVPKQVRHVWIAEKYRVQGYDMAKDAGGDVSDAIGLADWWWTRNLVASHAGK